MSIFERVATALETLNIPFSMQIYRTETGTSWPDLFMSYSQVTGTPRQHADDAETLRMYRIQVNIFSRSGLAVLPDVDGAMVAAGFKKAGSVQLPYDRETGHYGIAKSYTYLEMEEG